MKRTKVSSYLRGYPSHITVTGKKPYRFRQFKESVKLFFRRLTIASLVITIVATSYFITFVAGQLTAREPGEQTFALAHAQEAQLPPVLQRIGRCESRNNHFCSDDAVAHGLCKTSQKGQVLQRANKNGTIDTGKYQLNASYWGAELSAHGWDITKEADNEAAALYIFENYGTGAWSASSKCWK